MCELRIIASRVTAESSMDSSDVASTPDCEIQPSMQTSRDQRHAHPTIQSFTVPELMKNVLARLADSRWR
jgi:hypothetical protein